MRKGRKGNVPSDIIVNTILKYKNDILINHKIVSKSTSIWEKISKELSNYGQIKASLLYTFVVCDRNNLHALLEINFCEKKDLCNKNKNESSIQSLDTSFNDVINTNNGEMFTITLTKKEYQSLLDTKVYGKRICIRFKSGEWEDVIAQKIWNETRIQCGINFKGHYLTQNADYGSIDGEHIMIQEVL